MNSNLRTFRLLDLPYLAMKKVLSEVEPAKLIDLTFMSPIIRNVAINTIRGAYVHVNVTTSQPFYYFYFVIFPSFEEIKFEFQRDDSTSSKVTVNGQSVRMRKYDKNTFWFEEENNPKNSMTIFFNILSHVAGILAFPQTFSTFVNIPVFSTPIFNVFDGSLNLKYLDLREQVLTIEQVKYIIETVKTFELRLETEQVIAPRGPEVFQLNQTKIVFMNCEWFCFSSLLTMRCEKFHVGPGNKDHLKVSDLIAFVRAWSQGGFDEFQKLFITLPNKWSEGTVNNSIRTEIYNSLETMKLNVVVHENKRIIQREDKKTAELIIKPDRLTFEVQE